MLDQIIGQAVGRAIGEGSGLNGAARRAGFRTAVGRAIRIEAARLREEVDAAIDADAALRALAGHWLSLHRARAGLLHAVTVDTSDALASNRVRLAMFDGPALAALPMLAFGLRQVAHDEPVPVWIGRPEQLVATAEALVLAGHTTRVAADREHIDVYAGERQVAILLADPDYVVDDEARVTPRVPPSRVRVWVGWLALLVGLVVMGYGSRAAGAAVLALAPVAWIWHALVEARRRRRSREHRLRLTPLATTTPYRDGLGAAPITGALLVEALARAGLPATRRGGDLVIARGVRLLGGGAARVEGTALELQGDDVRLAMRCAYALTAAVGPASVQLGAVTVCVSTPEELASWEAARDQDDRRRAALQEAIAHGRTRAEACLRAL